MRTISLGLSLGLFCSMLPMPMQMVLAAILCLLFRANIPIAIAACWISNPLTQIPLWISQESIGATIRDTLHLGWLDFISIQGTIPFFEREVNLANFAVGVAVTSISLAILAFPAVWIFYAIVPKKYLQNPRAKIADTSTDNSKV